ncbi:MAG: iron-containing alcohol dehydrogenase [Christensenellaceae bacterium]|jgi:alcohol dehydrogenase YqhD (iron-dependent ADH family)
MENSVYYNPTKIIFGKGTEEQIGREVAERADRVLLHYGGKSAEKSGLLGRVRASLKAAGVDVYELGGVKPNPRLSLVYEGIQMCRTNSIGLILAVGGGSVIDSSKAIAFGTTNTKDVWHYMMTKEPLQSPALPVATILTIPGAGSESSSGTVITNDETMVKVPYNDLKLRPVLSILNPEITYTIPKQHAAAGIVDAFTHILERYFTQTKAVDVTDKMCEAVMRSIIKYGKRAILEPENYDVRAEIMWACKLAHDGSLGMGRLEEWSSHQIEHELSAKYDISHGAGLAIIYPAWMKHVYAAGRNRFIQFAIHVMGAEFNVDDPERTIFDGISRLKAFFESLGLPATLQDAGIPANEDFAAMAERCIANSGGSLGKFMPLTAKDVEEIYKSAL